MDLTFRRIMVVSQLGKNFSAEEANEGGSRLKKKENPGIFYTWDTRPPIWDFRPDFTVFSLAV